VTSFAIPLTASLSLFASRQGRRVCYSIETLKREAAKPMTYDLPSDKLCERLAKRDFDICRIPEGGSIKKTELKDLAGQDIEKLKVKEIKDVLGDNGVSCSDCTEKSDYVKKLRDLLVAKGIAAGKTEL
jgi:mesencephalic astrocyte-derived neurotrophic factor